MKTYDRGLVARAGRDRRRPVRLKVWVYVAFSPSKNWEERSLCPVVSTFSLKYDRRKDYGKVWN